MVAHESMGQQVLYRELKDNPKSKDLTLEAHHIVELLSLEELEKTPVTDEQWEAEVHRRVGEHQALHRAREDIEMFTMCR